MTIINIVTPAPTQALTTPSVVRQSLGLGDDVSDAQLTMWIDQISAAFAKSCERVFRQERVVERFDATHPLLWLSRRPVSAIHTVTVRSPFGSATTLDSSSYELISKEEGRLLILRGNSFFDGMYDVLSGDVHDPWHRRASIDVEYTGGYTVVPHDLEALAIMAVGRLKAEIEKKHPDILSERLGDYAYTLRSYNAATALVTGIVSPEIERGLAPYRKLGVA